jgi:hypothetical protein
MEGEYIPQRGSVVWWSYRGSVSQATLCLWPKHVKGEKLKTQLLPITLDGG